MVHKVRGEKLSYQPPDFTDLCPRSAQQLITNAQQCIGSQQQQISTACCIPATHAACNPASNRGKSSAPGSCSTGRNVVSSWHAKSEPCLHCQHILAQLGETFTEVPLEGASSFVKPASLLYQQSGKQKKWDVVQAHDSVAVLLYHHQRHAYIIVRQFRPAVYAAKLRAARSQGQAEPPAAAGLTFEMCAGIADKAGYTPAHVCSEEITEEVGYSVAPEQLLPITSFISSAGITGATQHTFFAEVDENHCVSSTGGTMAEAEGVEAVALPVGSVNAFIADDSLPKSPGLCFALLWATAKHQQ